MTRLTRSRADDHAFIRFFRPPSKVPGELGNFQVRGGNQAKDLVESGLDRQGEH